MQTIRTPTTKGKNIAVIALAILLLLGGGIALAATQNIGPFADDNSSDANSQTTNTSDDTDDTDSDDTSLPDETDEIKDGERSPNAEGGDKPITDSGNNPPQSSAFTVSLDSMVDGNEVRFTSLIQKVANSGTCRLTATNGSKTIERTAAVGQLGPQSTCQGFTIPKSEFSSGNWRASLRVTIGSQTGNASTAFKI